MRRPGGNRGFLVAVGFLLASCAERTPIAISESDPYGLDGDGDGVGCA
jgi:hypothetical protein